MWVPWDAGRGNNWCGYPYELPQDGDAEPFSFCCVPQGLGYTFLMLMLNFLVLNMVSICSIQIVSNGPPTSRNSMRMKEMFGMIFKLWWQKTLVDWAEKVYLLKAIMFIPSFWGSKADWSYHVSWTTFWCKWFYGQFFLYYSVFLFFSCMVYFRSGIYIPCSPLQLTWDDCRNCLR